MNIKKIVSQIVGLALTLYLLTGCGSPVPVPTTAPAVIPAPASTSVGTGTITGRVHLAAPPLPSMVVYAVDPTTGAWAFTETQATDGGEATFSITVPPGTYQIFGAAADRGATGVGYSMDDLTLATVTVATNQTVADIIVRPPSQFECGSMMGYPASPDGRFAALPGPAAECIATSQASGSVSNAGTGTITGRVHLMAPPTPRMVVYAVDQTTGAWAFAETNAADGFDFPTFSLTVPPGTYQVFGAVADGSTTAVGYSLDYSTLTPVTVAANQMVSDISVGPPSQFECGSTMGYPASPDGRFAAMPDPDANCVATSQASSNGPILPQTNRIQFQPNATSWQISDSIAPNGTIGFVLYAMKGQRMGINLTTDPSSSTSANPYVVLSLSGADNLIYTFVPVTNWYSG